MPFDAPVIHKQTLMDVMEEYGITPIPMNELLAYKAAQITKHTASLLYRHVVKLRVLVFAIASCGFWLPMHVTPVAWLIGILALPLASSVTIKGPAQWREEYRSELDDVPLPIRQLTQQIIHELPEASVFVGILTQDRIVLDPYLIVTYGWEVACLGIWEGDQVVRTAGHL